jgi:amino acid adenylation domain-containing protein
MVNHNISAFATAVREEGCIFDLIKARAKTVPDSVALMAPDRPPMTYGSLMNHVARGVHTLNDLGIGRGDRVAMVLPNGPEMSVAFMTISSCASAAPLNPSYLADELNFYLTDLNAKALVLEKGMASPARDVAASRGIHILEIFTEPAAEAGAFTFQGIKRSKAVNGGLSEAKDTALVLHTSGTTSRPKMVPLTQFNLWISARNISKSLTLTESDRCLNVMPLFHIHGLAGALLASIAAGAGIICSPGFSESDFFDWLHLYQPTWYTAVPTMHQAILARASIQSGTPVHHSLRFIRSCSSALPPKVFKALENAFRVPVIESYGMTEASHQMTANPLPPEKRKAGSVGMPAGVAMRIMDNAGNFIENGGVGEIVIQGENVTDGYENNPQANRKAFCNGWFRTGDQGHFDADGYLFITGRLKEIVNRGGEKVSPREVDEALLNHPDVDQALAFAMPHPTLGEDLAAAVVLRPQAAATEQDLRAFAFERLADFKVPSQIVIVDSIPKGATGKLQRIGLSEKLTAQLQKPFVAPRDKIETMLTAIWGEVLQRAQISVSDNFFALGGDSLRATRVISRVRATLQLDYPITMMFRKPTIAEFADEIRRTLPTTDRIEQQQSVEALDGTIADSSGCKCLHQLFEDQAGKTPESVAVFFENQGLTYGELDRRANQVAHRLCRLGVGPDILVALCFEHSLELIIGILGVLKAGGAYLPLDPAYPKERLMFMLQDAKPLVSLTRQSLLPVLPTEHATVICLDDDFSGEPDTAVASVVAPDNLAYCIYTSGSTGTPKGVLVTHSNVVRLFTATEHLFGFGPTDVWTLFHSSAFDFSVWEMWGALLYGGRLVVVSYFVSRSPDAFRELLRSEGVTVLNQTPSAFRQLIRADIEASTPGGLRLRYVIFGGEKLEMQSLRPWFAQHGDKAPQLINMYGITETTVHVTYRPLTVDDVDRPSVIGRPIPDLEIHLLDENLRPVVNGQPGEICVAGPGLARGYLNRDELTAERFILINGIRLYRSGDLARRLPNGDLEYLGRIDNQIKIRGHRIEPGEIETALQRHGEVQDAVVIVHDELLVAYVVAKGATVSVSDLRNFVKKKVPEYMVPSAFVLLDVLPLTLNGKVDRRLLPAPNTDRPELGTSYVAPWTPVQDLLAGIWCKLLRLERVGVHDDFFELGGHSLLATQVMSRVRAAFGVDLSLRALFESPTIAGLAAAVDAAICESATTGTQSGSIGNQNGDALLAESPSFPTSFAQRRLWFLDQLNPGQAVYIIDYAMRITGPLDVTVLERAINEIIHRHDSLRTTIGAHNGEPVQVFAEALTMTLPVIDISHEPQMVREARARTIAAEISNQPFDLARGPLLRLRLIRLDPQDHILAIPIHHIVADGWSLNILQKELAALYEAFCKGETSTLAELPIQYGDFTMWQREQLKDGPLQRQIEYWRGKLKDLSPLELPTDRPSSNTNYSRGAQCKKVIPAVLAHSIQEMGKRHGATLFMTLLAAFQLLLHRLSGQDDVTVGTPIAGRSHPNIEGLIGFFVNNLVLRTDLSGNPSFRELLVSVKETVLEAFEHQEIPFERLVEELRPPRHLGRNPLFDVMINFLADAGSAITRGGLHYQPIELEKTAARFALTLYISNEDGGGLGICMLYQAALFGAARVECMVDQLAALLQQIVDDPERPIDSYSLVTMSTQSLLPDPGLPLTEVMLESVTSTFLRRVQENPNQTALSQGDRRWSYQELAANARSLATSLTAWGVCKGDVVGISGDRSFGLVTAMLALLQAGGVMLTIDPMLPRLRRRTMLETAQARSILWIGSPGCDEHREYKQLGLPIYCLDPDNGRPWDEVVPDKPAMFQESEPDDPAYVFFTSGTTGVPKAVLGCHKGISHFVNWQRESFAIGPQDRVAQLTSFSFDVFLRDLFLPLTSGATLCLPEENDLYELPKWLKRAGITVLHTVPALVQTWLKDASLSNGLPEMRWVFIAGEPLTAALVQKWRKTFPGAGSVVNLYGPTETTLAKCYYLVPEDPAPGVQPIGMPLPQTQILIMGPDGCLCGIGEPGEIVVRTPYRTLGYLNLDEHTRSGFVMNPWCDDVRDLLYHTGDRGRYRPDGILEILGRLDDQVKIRGVRVEPAEVSAVLAQHPLVHACKVVSLVERSRHDECYLTAYVVPTAPNAVDRGTLREYLEERLPAVMIPATFTFLDSLPVTKSGKVDRKALPAQDPQTFQAATPWTAPRTPLERALARIWGDLLERTDISVHDNFFTLGGHSLLATQAVTQIRKQLRIDFPIRRFFEAPTISGLAALIEPIQPTLTDAHGMGIPRLPRIGGSLRINDINIDRMKT